MSFTINLPPSVVAKKTKSEEQDEPKKKSREDWRKQKELEEMRKAGTAPAMTDEEGKSVTTLHCQSQVTLTQRVKYNCHIALNLMNHKISIYLLNLISQI
jgi:ribosomal protein S25